jgi:hypothetical protein
MRKVLALISGSAMAGSAMAANVATSPTEVVLDPPPVARAEYDTVYVVNESFDDTTPGTLPTGWDSADLTAIQDDAYWNVSDRYVHQGSKSWWCGTSFLRGEGYGNLWRQQLDLTVDLTAVTGAVGVSWFQYFDSEWEFPLPPQDAWDGGTFRVSTDGGTTWDVVAPEGGFPRADIYAFHLQDGGDPVPGWSGNAAPAWERQMVDLSAYAGSEIMLRWDFASDMFASTEDGGYPREYTAWFIDEVTVGNLTGDIYYEDDMEADPGPEWNAHAGVIAPSGDWWEVVDSSHPQPDDLAVFYSLPHGLYVGDPSSSRGDGTYATIDHDLHPLDNVIMLPSVDLSQDPDMTTVWIEWQERMKGDGEGGYAYFDGSVDGGQHWTEIEMRTPSGKQGWGVQTYNITSYRNKADVRFRLRAGSGTAETHHFYWYVDDLKLYYLVEGTGIADGAPSPVTATELHPATPNPFNPFTQITYTLESAAPVSLQVYDVSGHLVRTLVSGPRSAGTHTVTFDGHSDQGASLPSGVYTARLTANDGVQTTRMLLLK